MPVMPAASSQPTPIASLRAIPPRELLAAALRLYADLSTAYFQALGPVSSSSTLITPLLPPLLQPHLSHLPLFQILPTSPPPHNAPRLSSAELLSLISSLDAFLAHLLDSVARVHASNQARIHNLANEARQLQEGVTRRTRQIKALKANLDGLIKEGEKERMAAARAEKAPINVSHLLSYADLLSRTTSAPPGYVAPEASSTDLAQAAAAASGVGTNGGAGVTGQDREKDSIGGPPADLPFPDEALMARSAIWGAPPKWSDFKEIAEAGTKSEGEGGQDSIQRGQTIQGAHINAMGQQRVAVAHQSTAPYDESDAFDLDLN